MNKYFFQLSYLILFLNGFTFFSDAQKLTTPFIIKKYTSFDGLPHNYVLNLRQDDHGYLWVGTAYGLSRFDGENFSPVNIKDEKHNIIATSGNQLPDGKLWIWPKNEKEFLYDGKNFLPVPDSLHKQVHNSDGFEGTTFWGDGMQYLSSLETRIGWFSNYRNKIIFVKKNGDSLQINQNTVPGIFMRIVGFAKGQLYFYTNQGLYAWDTKTVKPLFQKQILGKPIYSCFRDSKKRFWIGTRNEGVYVSKPEEENQVDYHISLANNLIAGFFEDKEKNIWIAGYEGLIKVQDLYFENISKNDFPCLWDINFITKGEKDDFFILSETNGLIRKSGDKFICSENNPFKGQLVDALCYDKSGRLWCISRQNRLLMYDGKKYPELSKKIISKTGDVYIDITYDEYRNKIWITSDSLIIGDESGFSVFKASNNQIIKNPTKIIAMPGGKLIVATDLNELLLIDSTDNIIDLNKHGIFVPKNIQNFYKDSSGNLFISSLEAGLIQCRLINNDSLQLIKTFSIENGLKNNFVNSISFDKQNRLWVSTMGGISVFKYQKNNSTEAQLVYQFGITDGLPEFTGYGRLACDEEGNMWYSTLYALLKFPKNKMEFYNKPPPVSIEKVTLNMKDTDWRKYTDSLTTFQLPVNPVMKYDDNTITIFFKAATMTNAENVQYSYLLSGINNYWSNSSKNNTITFAKLKPGNYSFFVRARTSNMNWSTPAIFSFTIRKPYWQQGWFTVLIIGAVVGIIYLFYRIRINQLHKEKQIRDQIAADLHDDLGSTLNSIKVYAELASVENENKEHLGKIKENTLEAIIGVRDIIWVLDDKKDKLEHLLHRFTQFAEPLCSAAHIFFTLNDDELTDGIKLKKEEKRNLYMILKESLNNSIKYAGCKYFMIEVQIKNRKLELKISDDGIGFETLLGNDGNGLRNIYSRSKEIGYTVTIDSGKGKGTVIMVTQN